MAIFSILSTGSSIVIAQAIGSRKLGIIHKVIHQTMVLNVALGLLISAIILIFDRQILNLLNTQPPLLDSSSVYLRWLGACVLFEATSLILSAILRVHNFNLLCNFGELFFIRAGCTTKLFRARA